MKYNPIKVCSCYQCRHSNKRRFYFQIANRKFRHGNKQKLKIISFNLSEIDKIDIVANIAGGYTD